MEKRRKEIAFLAIALVVLILAVALQMRSATPTPAAAKPAARAQAQPAPAPGAAAPKAAITLAPAALAVIRSVRPPLAGPVSRSGRDPFISALPKNWAPPQVKVASTFSPSRPFSFLPRVPPVTPLFGSTGSMLPGLSAGSTTPATPVAAAPAPAVPATPRLVGVVSGEVPMAIIRKGEQRYYPRLGEYVGDYKVTEISPQRVVLTASRGTLSLELGGNSTP